MNANGRLRRRARRRVVMGVVAALCATLVYAHRERLRHLAVPVLNAAPRPASAPPWQILERAAGTAALVGRVPARVTAMARGSDGTLFAGTFDQGVYRLRSDGTAVSMGALEGRERFVNALVIHRGELIAATYRGAIVIGSDGLRRDTLLAERAVESLVRVGECVLAGTERGVYQLPGTALPIAAPGGEAIRASALAFSDGTLFIGSPSGIYSVAWPGPGAWPARATAEWRPIVFGEPGAETNVVTALAAIPGGVLAGTDDGGIVKLLAHRVRATRFGEPRANEINPGALVSAGGAIYAGTQGAGVLRIDAQGATRPTGWPAPQVSALASDGNALLAGAADGAIWTLPL